VPVISLITPESSRGFRWGGVNDGVPEGLLEVEGVCEGTDKGRADEHYLTNPPFLHFSVTLDSSTFATTLILLNNCFLVTAWSYENNSTLAN
jgi:hypothetical protein